MNFGNNGNEKKFKKSSKKFYCEHCDYSTIRESQFNRHLLTRKHKMEIIGTFGNPEETPKNAKSFMCLCGKNFVSHSGLWKHKKKCNFEKKEEKEDDEEEKEEKEEKEEEEEDIINNTIVIKKKLKKHSEDSILHEMLEVIKAQSKENLEQAKVIQEQAKAMQEKEKTLQAAIPRIGNTTNTINNTQNFNLNTFLNEDCKDALNLMDFVKSLQIGMEDLDTTGKLGFVESASKLLIKGLSELDVNKRPIHCSDLKRETLYIKDNDVWEKETETKEKIQNVVKELQHSSFCAVPNWVKHHPGCQRGDNKYNNEYMEIVGNTAGVDKEKDVNKIIKKLAKEVIINKNKD